MVEVPNRGSFDSLSDFISVAKGVIATGEDLNEENTKAKLVTPLIRTLGWRVYDNDEVLLEYSGEKEFDSRADYALFGPEGVYAVVEAKRIGQNIDNSGAQIRRYMRLFDAEWGLLTNTKKYLIFQADDSGSETQVESLSLVDLPSSAYVQDLYRQSAYAESVTAEHSRDDVPQITAESRRQIEEFVARKRASEDQQPLDSFGPLYDSLIEAIAPSVHGHEAMKLALLFSLVGGVSKSTTDGRSVRGAIHTLVVHDPGTLITDVAELAARLSPQAVYILGNKGGQPLSPQTNPDLFAGSELSDYSINTLAHASHAVVTRLDRVTEDELQQMQKAFSMEIPSDSSEGANTKQTPGLIATSRPKYGRFDEHEPNAEQINLEPALISAFDVVFIISDQPDQYQDRNQAKNLIQANYGGELDTQLKRDSEPDDVEDIDQVVEEVAPAVDAEFLRKHITYARHNFCPTMTEEAQQVVEDFFVQVRSDAIDGEGVIPITTRKLEAIIRLTEASARLRLSNTVDREDANRVVSLVKNCLGIVDTEPMEKLDPDMVETGTTEEQMDRIRNIKDLINSIEKKYEAGAPVDVVVARAQEMGMERSKAKHEIEKLKQNGDAYEPRTNYLRTT